MSDRLIGGTPYPLTIKGVTYLVKPMSIGEKRAVATEIAQQRVSKADFGDYIKLIASRIDSVVGFNGTPEEFLLNELEWADDVILIQNCVLSLFQLSEKEIKNFASLSGGSSSSEPAREPGTTQQNAQPEPVASASPTSPMSLSPSAVDR